MLINEHYAMCLTEIFFLIMWENQCLEKYARICKIINNNCYLKSQDKQQNMWIRIIVVGKEQIRAFRALTHHPGPPSARQRVLASFL